MLYAFLLFSPLYIVFVWQFFNAKKAISRGQATLLWRYSGSEPPIALRKWRHNPKDAADVTEEEIKQAKVSAAAGIIILTVMIIVIILIATYK